MKTGTALVMAGLLLFVLPLQALADSGTWSGSVNGAAASVYGAPGGTPIGQLDSGAHVSVTNWEYGPALTSDNYTWAQLDSGGFVHSSALRHAPLSSPPPPPQIISSAHWADVNLTQQTVALYDGETAVRVGLMSSGRPGPDTESHPGIWPILRRVADERMRGDGYDISGVLFTQYFTTDAEALHLNYWLSDDERGIPRSHGCIGLTYSDAEFAWQFLDVGSLVYVHA